jgi:hypothetical protein
MAINFSNNQEIKQESSRITAPGRVVQIVETVTTSGAGVATTNATDLFTSPSITLTNPNNRVLVQLYSSNRTNDWGDGVWNLHYMDIVHVQSGTQLSYTGYNGDQTNNIRHVTRSFLHTPGSVGPHSYRARGWCYQNSSVTFITGGDGTVAYLRLIEIAA